MLAVGRQTVVGAGVRPADDGDACAMVDAAWVVGGFLFAWFAGVEAHVRIAFAQDPALERILPSAWR